MTTTLQGWLVSEAVEGRRQGGVEGWVEEEEGGDGATCAITASLKNAKAM